MIMIDPKILIRIDDEFSANELLDEVNDVRYRNRGRIIALSPKASEAGLKLGDMVHFSDLSGYFPYKEKDRNVYCLFLREVLFVSEDKRIYCTDDLSFDLMQEMSWKEQERIAYV